MWRIPSHSPVLFAAIAVSILTTIRHAHAHNDLCKTSHCECDLLLHRQSNFLQILQIWSYPTKLCLKIHHENKAKWSPHVMRDSVCVCVRVCVRVRVVDQYVAGDQKCLFILRIHVYRYRTCLIQIINCTNILLLTKYIKYWKAYVILHNKFI